MHFCSSKNKIIIDGVILDCCWRN